MTIVSAACQGETSCTVQALNSVFGDPCGGTYKYLTVNYACMGGGGAVAAARVMPCSSITLDLEGGGECTEGVATDRKSVV